MQSKFKNLLVFFFLLLSVSGCIQSEYTRLVKKELAKNIRYDSLFLTFRFNDTRTEFYTKGWEQNRLGLIRQGPNNQNVEYMMRNPDSTKSNIQMLFFPEFDTNDRIRKMEMFFKFTSWSAVTKGYKSDELFPIVLDSLTSWYGGNEFIEVKYPKDSVSLWVKVDGNRQISMTPINDAEIKVVITDLTWQKQTPKNEEQHNVIDEDQNM